MLRLLENTEVPPVAVRRPTNLRDLRRQVHARLIDSLDGESADALDRPEVVSERIGEILWDLSRETELTVSLPERRRIESEILDDLKGMGPLASLMLDRGITDILVNGPDEVWIDRCGQLERTDLAFDDDAHLRRFIDRLVAGQGRHLDARHPQVDARLPDGSRLHAVIPPLCPRGAVVSIRRFQNESLKPQDLVERGMLDQGLLTLLELAVGCGQNIVIAGSAGAGKTTLLNILSGFIPEHERVVTVEETAELKLDHGHVIPLEARQQVGEVAQTSPLRELVRTALRMRADRIIVGEVRGAEVLDMLQAMNVGHDGSLTTVHANSPQDVLRRLEALAHMGDAGMPRETIRDMIGSAVHLIVQVMRFRDGQRRIVSLCEVHDDQGSLKVNELYRYKLARADIGGGIVGHHECTGAPPRFLERAQVLGYLTPDRYTGLRDAV